MKWKNYSKNNTDNNGDELIYFFHEGEDGEEVLYQYEFNDEEPYETKRNRKCIKSII